MADVRNHRPMTFGQTLLTIGKIAAVLFLLAIIVGFSIRTVIWMVTL